MRKKSDREYLSIVSSEQTHTLTPYFTQMYGTHTLTHPSPLPTPPTHLGNLVTEERMSSHTFCTRAVRACWLCDRLAPGCSFMGSTSQSSESRRRRMKLLRVSRRYWREGGGGGGEGGKEGEERERRRRRRQWERRGTNQYTCAC